MPEFQAKSRAIEAEIDLLRQHDTSLVNKVRELDQNASQFRDNLARTRQDLEQQRRQAKEKGEEVNALLREAGEILAELTGKRYSITYS